MRLTNTLTGKLEEFVPLDDKRVGIYVCGVTPYEQSHVGHAMSAIIYDVLVRYLRWEGNPAGGYDVTYVSNYTDVDDKVIDRARELDRDPLELVAENIEQWEGEQRALNLTPPDVRPRVTTHIDTIVEAIEAIIEAGYGYATEAGDVYYRVRANEEYGKLSHQNIDQLLSGTRGEPGEGKEFPLDFALWKAAKPGEPHWPSPWGEGRPGWHIECSAMSQRYLGASFDIHGGGLDLVFPHHENEVAQAEAVSGPGTFAQIWLHNGLVQRDSEKMSKSIGNVVTVAKALKRWSADWLRYFVLSSHYRSPNNLTDDAMASAAAGTFTLRQALHRKPEGTLPSSNLHTLSDPDARLHELQADFIEAMENDLNTPRALAALHGMARVINQLVDAGLPAERAQGLFSELARKVLGLRLEETVDVGFSIVETLDALGQVQARLAAIENMQFKDRLSRQLQQLTAKSRLVELTQTDLSPVVEMLIGARDEFRQLRAYESADAIRDALSDAGIKLEDTSAGTKWQLVGKQ